MNDGDHEILNCFVVTRDKTIELARRVPEGFLAQTPDGEDMPLNQLFAHIADSVDWWMSFVMSDGRGRVPPEHHHDRNMVIAALSASRDRLVTFFSADDGAAMGERFSHTEKDGGTTTFVGRDRVLYLVGHETHHRGKIVLTLRQWGLTDIPFLPW